jgi:hypothetical protein
MVVVHSRKKKGDGLTGMSGRASPHYRSTPRARQGCPERIESPSRTIRITLSSVLDLKLYRYCLMTNHVHLLVPYANAICARAFSITCVV